MDSKQGTKQVSRSYTDFEPSFEWSRGQESDILRVHLPGFKREHIKVQVDDHGTLRAIGERPIEDNHWRRFGRDFRIPKNSKINGIRAKFENETLVISIPKEITQAQPAVPNKLPTNEKPAPTPAKPTFAPTSAPTPALAPREKPTNGKLADLIGAEKEEEKMRAKKEEEKLEKMNDKPIQETRNDKPIQEKMNDKPIQEKMNDKPKPIQEKMNDKPIQEKIRETLQDRVSKAMKEETQSLQTGGTVTGLRNPRKMLILNVVVAIIVLVGIGLYTSFKLRRVVIEEAYGEKL